MPDNQINANGIQIQTYAEIVSAIVNGVPGIPGYKQIYGSDIIVDANTPDGQQINIYALSKEDVLQLIVQDYNSKDPDQAVGVALDGVSQLCGIMRQGATYTYVDLDVVLTATVALVGLDNPSAQVFTAKDGNGNLFYLVASATLAAGSHSLSFRAALIGDVQVLPNTITIPVTILSGVSTVNNPAVPTQQGIDEETDAEFRIRRQKSTGYPSQGFLDSLVSGLSNVDGVTAVKVYENNEDAEDGNGVPGHSIWVIVAGGTDEDVANEVYRRRNAGCGMKGDTTYNIVQVDESTFEVAFDRPTYESLYAWMHLESKTSGSIDTNAAKAALAAWSFGIYEAADISTMDELVRASNPDIVVSSALLGTNSNGAGAGSLIFPTAKSAIFVLNSSAVTIT